MMAGALKGDGDDSSKWCEGQCKGEGENEGREREETMCRCM